MRFILRSAGPINDSKKKRGTSVGEPLTEDRTHSE